MTRCLFMIAFLGLVGCGAKTGLTVDDLDDPDASAPTCLNDGSGMYLESRSVVDGVEVVERWPFGYVSGRVERDGCGEELYLWFRKDPEVSSPDDVRITVGIADALEFRPGRFAGGGPGLPTYGVDVDFQVLEQPVVGNRVVGTLSAEGEGFSISGEFDLCYSEQPFPSCA